MKLKLALCDDIAAQLSLLQTYVERWAAKREIQTELLLCQSAEQFFFHWEEKKDVDILLLDIEMPGMDGMTAAKKLRALGDKTQILFVTGRTEYALEGYEVDAVSYVLKPVKEEQLSACLDRAVERLHKEEPVLLVESAGGEVMKVKISDICYLESAAHDTLIYTTGQEEAYRSKNGITELSEELLQKCDKFFKLHRSYLVSIPHIKKITKKEVFLENGTALPIARGKWEELNQAYLSYYRREMGR